MSFAKKLVSSLVVSSLVLGCASMAFAAPPEGQGGNAQGRGNGAAVPRGKSMVKTVSASVYKQVGDRFVSAASVMAGETFYLVASVSDQRGNPVIGLEDQIQVVAPADTLAKDVATVSFYTADEIAALTFGTDDPGISLQPGQYVIELIAGKAGVMALGATYTGAQRPITNTRSIHVSAGELAALSVNGGNDVNVNGLYKMHGPYRLALTDIFGNPVVGNPSTRVRISQVETDGMDASLTLFFRQSLDGPTVVEFTIRSTTDFYFYARETGIYTVTLTLDDLGLTSSFVIVVE